MDETTKFQLNRIYATVDYMINLDGQDSVLVVEMSQAMINDLIESGQIEPIVNYVKRYCDVIDNPEMADEIAADI